MKAHHLDDMIKGWFLGDFDPVAYRTPGVEVAIKKYNAGDKEEEHYHKVAVELTVIIAGEVKMFGRRWTAGDIITVEAGESTAFEALTDVTTVVVKVPSVANDKYMGTS